MPPPASIRRSALVAGTLALALFALLVSEGRPSGLVERGPFTSDFFDEQARSLLDGRLDVDPAVARFEGFERDGDTFLYFGLVPSVARLPVVAVTDRFDGRLTQLSMLLALAVTLWAATRLVWRGRRWCLGDGEPARWEPAVVGAFVLTVGISSPLLFLSARPVVYHEAELWGAATALVAFEAILRWWEEPNGARLAWTAAAVTIALNTRASVGGGAAAAFALTAALALLWRRRPWRAAPMLVLSVLAPVAVYAAINVARFDSLVTIPFEDQQLSRYDANRQATLVATDGSLFGLEFAPTALLTYLRPDGADVQRLFPWLTFREEPSTLGNPTFDTIDRSASLFVVAPVLVGLGAWGLAVLVRRRERDPWLALVAAAAIGVGATVTIAFIANRYLSDFVPLLVIPASIGVWGVAVRVRRSRGAARRAAIVGLPALAGLATLASIALTLQSQKLFLLPTAGARTAFVDLQYDVDRRLQGNPPPDVRQTAGHGAVGPRGAIEIVGACQSLNWSDGRRWFPLELGGDRGWSLVGTVADGRTDLLRGPTWSLVVSAGQDELVVSYEPLGGPPTKGTPIERAADREQRFLVGLDAATGEARVELDGTVALEAWPVDVNGPVQPDDHWDASSLRTPLCDDLLGRLDG